MEIVKENIPLLLGKTSLEKAETVLDMKGLTFTFLPVDITVFDIQPNKVTKMDLPVEGQNESVLIFEENMNLFDMKKQIQKIHRQFGHASSEKIKRLIKNARVTDQEFFEITDEVIQGCDFCLETSCWFCMGN